MEWLRNEWYLQNWCKLWNAIPIKLIKSWNNLFQQTMAIRISEGKYNLNDLLHIKMSLKWVHRPWSPVPTIRLIFIYCIFKKNIWGAKTKYFAFRVALFWIEIDSHAILKVFLAWYCLLIGPFGRIIRSFGVDIFYHVSVQSLHQLVIE